MFTIKDSESTHEIRNNKNAGFYIFLTFNGDAYPSEYTTGY